ncbi:MAG TPA: M1 family metallopeptidase [Chitinophagaceae bacterium]|nr:M1 family metallopeptidase [Chitinophagaceae bacterium]
MTKSEISKKYFHYGFFFFLFALPLSSYTQLNNYWQQEVNYNIAVSLDDKEHTLDGFEKIEYINNSPDTLRFIWFHLWPNAYKNDKTLFSDQLLENGSTKFYFSDKEQKGYINRLDFKVDDITADIEDHPQHIDIVKVILPVLLAPGQKTIITTPFHVKLPYNFSRGGHEGESYQATQWYPKPAVYDKSGWHPIPYLDQGEFYSEFGKFDVSITVPQNYVVAATGELQNAGEKEWLKTRSTFSWEPVKQKEKLKSGEIKTTTQLFPESAKETKTLRFTQNNIHDFAWFADKRFTVKQDTVQLSSGRIIDVFSYYTRPDYTAWQNAVQSGKDAIHHYSSLVGEYPYNVVSIVQGPESFGGGMEYPTITVISQTANIKSLDKTIVHEVGHNWFYGILANNERDHPWMDEGVNSYYEAKYAENKYGQEPQLERLLFETKAVTKTDQPIDLSSEKYSEINYGLSVYYKTAEWLRYLEEKIGTDLFNKAMQEYFHRWKFRHPYPIDFKKTFEEVTNRNLDSIFQYQSTTGILPNQQRSGTRTTFVFDIKSLKEYGKNPTKNLIIFGPALGANSYDKLMAGAFVTNIKMPPSAFQFLAAPMYSTGAKKIVGLGKIFYSIYPKGIIRRVDIGVNGSTFTMDKFTNSFGETSYLGFYKIVPTLRLTVRERDERSSLYKYIQFKSFYFGEDELRFYRDTIINGMDTTIENRNYTVRENRTLNQLKLVIENNRVLYPYKGELNIEQGKDFVRTAFTGNYFFNYPKAGGLDVRLFAGKFFYTGSKTISKQFETSRYHLNMTGANGYEDYTYSDYFIGRNKFEGFASQQIMIRDGAFKVRTDLLADKVGKTDNWLIAANFSSTIPESINPLSLLPVKIPIKLFFDIGTYAETWKQDAETDRFLYDAGLQIPLLEGLVNIYIPLIYSSVYKSYIQSTIIKKERFWKKISFSIDISNFNFRKIGRNFSF